LGLNISKTKIGTLKSFAVNESTSGAFFCLSTIKRLDSSAPRIPLPGSYFNTVIHAYSHGASDKGLVLSSIFLNELL